MGSFYKACKILSNKVVSDYNEGKYFNTKTHSMESLTKGTNKYNLQFIQEVKDISTDFYVLITLEQVAIKLMKMNSNSNEAEIRNLWNLIKAQAGTIRYNRILRYSLKTYAISKQKLLDELTGEMYKQRDRVKRNNALVIQLLRDYGLGKIIDLVEQQNNMTIFEHIKQFTLNNDFDMTRGLNVSKAEGKTAEELEAETEAINNYYAQIQDSYIDYLRGLAHSNNLSFDNEISEELELHRQIVEERYRQIDEAKAKEKADAKISKAFEAMDRDNAKIFSDLTSNWWDTTRRMGQVTAEQLRAKLEKFGGKIYYIACCKQSAVQYVTEQDKLDRSLFRMKYFKTAEEAELYITSLKEADKEIEKCFHKVYKLEIPEITSKMVNQADADDLTAWEKSFNNDLEKEISTLGQLLSNRNLTDNEKRVVNEVITKAHGYSSNRLDATFNLYKLIDKRGKQKLISITNNQAIELIGSYYKALKTIPNTAEEKQIIEKITRLIQERFPDSVIRSEQITFNSEWAKIGMDYIQRIYNKIQAAMQGNYSLIRNIEEKEVYERFIQRLFNLKQSGVNQIHLIVEADTKNEIVNRYLLSDNTEDRQAEQTDNEFLKNRVHYTLIRKNETRVFQKRTKYIDKADIFTSYEEALKTIETYKDNSTSLIYRIITLNL